MCTRKIIYLSFRALDEVAVGPRPLRAILMAWPWNTGRQTVGTITYDGLLGALAFFSNFTLEYVSILMCSFGEVPSQIMYTSEK